MSGLKLTESNDKIIIDECKKWNLNKQNIDKIFKISSAYEYTPYHAFSQTPCDIIGKAKLNGKVWDFYINGGGMITLTNNTETIYRGCDSIECEPFFILSYDGINP
ncbi:hypothetical protein [Xenorhabdus vietnamensis]|uniref:hypothetical protein n=1 Tax=Xenorhabdus vietnamensis TaxID=351656 RepID=UPI00111C8A20|nr:hypothetical protein [Xenorhabdus vietnamensis]